MSGTLLLVELAGHVGLLVWGTHMVGTGVQRGFGTVLRGWLERNLNDRRHAFLTGIGITALLQSSTATGLLATSFTANGVIGLAPALAVMLGANVGTALSSQLLSFNPAPVGPPLVLLGVLAFRWASASRLKSAGRISIGLGLMLMALAGLVHTLAPLEHSPLWAPVIGSLADDPVLAVLLAAALTWACHSSIAIVLLVGSLAANHVVGPSCALALVLGANLGGGLPALLNAPSRAALRLPLGNLLVRASGVLCALPFLHAIAVALGRFDTGALRLAVDFHLLFNVVLAAAYLGFTRQLARLMSRWLPDDGGAVDPGRPLHLEPSALASRSVALANAMRETLRVADMIDGMLVGAREVVCGETPGRPESVAEASRYVHRLGEAIRRYLADLGAAPPALGAEESPVAQSILLAVVNLEHVADILVNGIVGGALRGRKQGRRLNGEESILVAAMHCDLLDCLRLAMAVLLQSDTVDARRLIASKARFREFEANAMTQSTNSLRSNAAGERASDLDPQDRGVEQSGLLLRTVRDLRRIQSHLASLAYPVLHRDEDRRAGGDPPLLYPARPQGAAHS
jgi:phosphate:Na+ symporter